MRTCAPPQVFVLAIVNIIKSIKEFMLVLLCMGGARPSFARKAQGLATPVIPL